MSAHLGPIHVKMYGRVLYQDALARALLGLTDERGWGGDVRARADAEAPEASSEPLESIIDPGNIHGWLGAAVATCENRFAIIAGGMLDGHPERLDDMRGVMGAMGRGCALPSQTDAEQAFQAIHDILLDGMPCDFPFEVTQSDADAVVWTVSACPHAPHWSALGYDPEHYYLLRDAWADGALERTGILHSRAGGKHALRRV